MSIPGKELIDALSSYCTKMGIFDSVSTHEPKSSPGRGGVSVSLWIADYQPIQSSGLNSVSMRLEVMLRIYTSMIQEPMDAIDTNVLGACDALLAAFIGDFDLGVTGVRYIDVFGSDGEGLRAQLGYLNQDSKIFRVMDIFVPILVNDVYTEQA